MCDGIDASAIVVVFITKRYVEKVSGDNAADNCQKEFNYAELKKTSANMIAAVMEPRMKDPRLWDGAVGMTLGGKLYYALDSDETFEPDMEQLCRAVIGMIQAMGPGAPAAFEISSGMALWQAQHEVRECPVSMLTKSVCTSNTTSSSLANSSMWIRYTTLCCEIHVRSV